MATFTDTFFGQTPCGRPCLPTGWTWRWTGSPGGPRVVSNGGAVDGIALNVATGGTSTPQMFSYDAVTGETVLDIRARFYCNSTSAGDSSTGTIRPGIAVAASFPAGAPQGYVFRLSATGSQGFYLTKYIAGSPTDIASTAFAWSADTWYQLHLSVNLTTNVLRGSVWADTDPEPGSWMIDTTDASITTGGWIGFAARIFSVVGTDEENLDWITVGTAGSLAPNPSATLTAPSIAGVADSGTQITVTTTPGAAATDHNHYRSTTPGFTPGGGTLIAAGVGASPAPYAHTGLSPATDYYFVTSATDGSTTLYSSEIYVETDGAGAPPDLRLLSFTTTSLKVGVDHDPLWLEVRYRITLASDPTFAAPIADLSDATAARYDHAFGSLSAVPYNLQAKVLYAGGWSKWSAVLTATPAAFVVSSIQPWLTPVWAQPISGLVRLSWSSALVGPLTLDITDDDGATTTTLATGLPSTGGFDFYSPDYADGPVFFLLTDTSSGTVHPWFVIIDNGGGAYVADGQYTNTDVTDPAQFGRILEDARWGAFLIYGGLWYCPRTTTSTVWTGGGNDPAGLAPVGWPVSRQMDVSVHGRIGTTGGGYCWSTWYPAEQASIGLLLSGRGGGSTGVPAQGVLVTLNSGFLGACGGCGNQQDGTGPGTLSVTVIAPTGLGSGVYSASVPAHIIAAGPSCPARMCDFYHIRGRVTMPDPDGQPNVIRVQAMYYGPGATYSAGTLWQIDKTFTLLDNLSQPVNWECGYAAYATSHAAGIFAPDGSVQDLRQLTAIIEDDTCEPPPLIPPGLEPPPFFPAPVPCYLYATVYDDDRVTPLWQVSTDPTHPFPYMIDTGSTTLYGAQEIDPIEGRASIAEVTIGIIDPATIPGDQDSGWLTARLKGLRGRRVRVERGISLAIGTVVIADGPAGSPRMA